MISANGGLPAHRYTPQVTPRWPRGSEPASALCNRWKRVLQWALKDIKNAGVTGGAMQFVKQH